MAKVELRRTGATLSTIAIGDDADAALLQLLAEEGNGRFRVAATTDQIPTLALEETRLVIDLAASPGAVARPG